MENIKGIIFDYGGTLDSRGTHWSEVIWDGYRRAFAELPHLEVGKDIFREAYVYAERTLARQPLIKPQDNFLDMMRKKVAIELDWLATEGGVTMTADERSRAVEIVACHCDAVSAECVAEARPMLERLADRFPMMLVSNFYGNVTSVLEARDIRRLFKGVIESAVVGVRKPNPVIFRLGVDVLELRPEEVLVVGDSLTKDIQPAETLGCQVLWLKGKGWTAAEDAATHPAMIHSVLEVEHRLEVD